MPENDLGFRYFMCHDSSGGVGYKRWNQFFFSKHLNCCCKDCLLVSLEPSLRRHKPVGRFSCIYQVAVCICEIIIRYVSYTYCWERSLSHSRAPPGVCVFDRFQKKEKALSRPIFKPRTAAQCNRQSLHALGKKRRKRLFLLVAKVSFYIIIL